MANNNLSNVKRYVNSSAREGAHHWWMQRFTALVLIVLVTWFVTFFIKFGTHPVIHIMTFLAQPFNTMLVISLMVAAIYHANIGMKVIIEDYVHCEFYKNLALIKLNIISWFTLISGVIAMMFYHISYYVVNSIY